MSSKLPKIKLHVITVIDADKGTILHVFDSESRPTIEKAAKKALAQGNTVVWEDGRKEWLHISHRVNLQEKASKQYTWDKTGNKVLADVILMTKTKDGKITERMIRTKYVDL